MAEASIAQAQTGFDNPIVTELSPAPEFYTAETYHQNYYDLNSTQGYCQAVIAPKVQKFMTRFPEKLVPLPLSTHNIDGKKKVQVLGRFPQD